jgi:hypothetical protein
MEGLFRRLDEVLASKGYLAMGGQIIDAILLAAPRQKLSIEEKATIREGGADLRQQRTAEVDLGTCDADAEAAVA